MNKGEIAALGSPTELKSAISGDLVTLALSGPATNVLLPREFGSIVNNDQEIIKIQTDHAETALPKLIEFFSKSGLRIESISISRPTLDDVFTKYTKSSLTGTRAKECTERQG